MNISSVILRALPERYPQLLAQLAEVPGLEVHGVSPDGKLILTLEDTNGNGAADTYVKLHDFEGVLSVSLVYQHSDDELDTECDSEEAGK